MAMAELYNLFTLYAADVLKEAVDFISELTGLSHTLLYAAVILFCLAVIALILATVAAIAWMFFLIIRGIVRFFTGYR